MQTKKELQIKDEKFIERLEQFLNDSFFHLLSHQIKMCIYQQIGSITYHWNDALDSFIKFLEEQEFVCEVNHHVGVIYFMHKDLFKEDEEKSFTSLWSKLSHDKANEFLKEKYNIPHDREIENSYWYSLDIHNDFFCMFFYTFRTVGSEIRGNRNIETYKREFELSEFQRFLEPVEINTINKEDFIKTLTELGEEIALNDVILAYNQMRDSLIAQHTNEF